MELYEYGRHLFIGKLLFRKVKIESYFKPLSHYDSDFMIPSYESIIINSYMLSNWSISENFTIPDYDSQTDNHVSFDPAKVSKLWFETVKVPCCLKRIQIDLVRSSSAFEGFELA